MRLPAPVVLETTSGYTLSTDRLRYDHDTQTVTTPSLLRLESSGVYLEGRDLVFHVQTKKLELNEQVRGIFER